jgi:hypothetical protein
VEQNLIFLQLPGGFGHRSLFQTYFALGRIMAANNGANQGQALLTNLTDVGNESKTDACHCFACKLAIQFAWPSLQPRSPVGGGIHGHRPVTTVFMSLPLSGLLNLLPKTLD